MTLLEKGIMNDLIRKSNFDHDTTFVAMVKRFQVAIIDVDRVELKAAYEHDGYTAIMYARAGQIV